MSLRSLTLSVLAASVIVACSSNNTPPSLRSTSVVEHKGVARDSEAAATPSPAPTPIYTNATPYANFVSANPSAKPIAFSINAPTGSYLTAVVSIKCDANTNGGTAISLMNSWYLEGGTCNGTTNPTGATGTHIYDEANSLQASPTNSLKANTLYLIAATQNGASLVYYLCTPTCASVSTADAGKLASGTSGSIGSANGNQRIELGDLWNVQVYNYAMTATQIQTLANAAPPDPYPTVTPNSNATYTNASPVPEGGALGGTTVGPAYAPDSFHIDWDKFCVSLPSHCTNGNPNYVSNSAAMVTDTISNSFYDEGVTNICSGALANTAGNTSCGFGVGVYYAKSSDLLVTVTCANGFGCGYGPNGTSGSLNGAQIYIPSGSLPQQGSDGHMSIKQPSGVICQLYFGSNAHSSKITTTAITVGAGACGPADYATEGSSLMTGGGYAANDEMSRGFVRPEDIVGSNGDGTDAGDPNAFYHAMYGGIPNNQQGYVWPADATDGSCTSANTINGAMPVEGMFLYLDTAGYQSVVNWAPPIYLRWLKRALGSVHKHGMIDMDSSGCTTSVSSLYINTLQWGSQSYVQGGGVSPLDAYLKNYIEPYDSMFQNDGGSEGVIYYGSAGSNYAFDVLYYQDVPGLSLSNFHWINMGCGQIAVQGSSSNPC